MNNQILLKKSKTQMWRLMLILLVMLIGRLPCLEAQGTSGTLPQFTNPIWATGGADPWIYQEGGLYYFTYTQGSKIVIYRTGDITHLGDVVASAPAYATVYTPPPTMKDIWAPELHKINGKWYVYFAADDGTNANHRMYVIENSDTDPTTSNWTLKGQVGDATNNWAIDGTVMAYNNQLYMLWSGWTSTTEHVQSIYIAKLSDPWTVDGNRVLISTPEYDWEGHGLALNEGPEAITNPDGNVYVTYSASLYSTDNYCLGLLTLTPGADPMVATSWTKNATPVFSRNDAGQVYGPGHNGFFKSPDGTEDWIVYHARSNPNGGSNNPRNVRIQPFSWNSDGTPDFGTAVAQGELLDAPSSNYNLPTEAFSMIWRTNLTNSTATTISFNAVGSGFNIHWESLEDAAVFGGQTGANGTNTINFPAPGAYLVSITESTGNFNQFAIGTSTPSMLLSVEQWGNIEWLSFKDAFKGATNLEIHALDKPDLTHCMDMSGAFRDCSALTENTAMVGWNTSSITNLSNTFRNAAAFNQDIGNWDIGNVTTMDYTFAGCKAFNQPLGDWNTSHVTNMSNLFNGALRFNHPIGGWDVSKVSNIGHVVQSAHAFNQDLSNWDVSGATNMAYMFYDAASFNSNIGNWNVAGVTNMVRLLDGASSFDQNIGTWDLRSVAAASNNGTDGSLVNALSNSGMSCNNYSQTLKGWDLNPNTPTGLTLTATGLSYDDSYATTYHDDLLNNKRWTIEGDVVGNCTVTESTLPVSLISFVGFINNGTATLIWQTGVETGIDHFELEAVYNEFGIDPVGSFIKLGNIAAKGSGNSYQLRVAQEAANGYYRLKIVDDNGDISYGPKLVQLTRIIDNYLKVYPNPANDYVQININTSSMLHIYSSTGTLIKAANLHAGTNKISLIGLTEGVYFMQVGEQKLKLIKK